MYALETREFLTPRGHPVQMTYRQASSDFNTISSVMQPHDEYGLAAYALSGRAADVGSHVGSAAIALLMDNPDLFVLAVEPVPPNVELLRQNLAQNGLTDRCQVIEAAVGTGKTTIIRYGSTAMIGDTEAETENATHHAFIGNSALVYPKSPQRPHEARTVPVIHLAELGPLSFLKIDCEGGEWGLLTGPTMADVALIVGEAHPVLKHVAPDIISQLAATHDVTLNGLNQAVGPCGFVAVRR